MPKKKEETVKPEIVPGKRGIDLIFGDGDPEADPRTISEKTLEKVLEEMFSADNIDLKSDINNAQITGLTRGYIFSTVYKSKYMGSLVKHILELSVSKNREGRKEFVKLLQSSHGGGEEEPLKIMRRRFLE